ncbi:hypothetical protein ACWEPM_36000 [Streptomyces sp. NPDC004244]
MRSLTTRLAAVLAGLRRRTGAGPAAGAVDQTRMRQVLRSPHH